MKTLLPNVNTSEGCFEIGVTISNPVSATPRFIDCLRHCVGNFADVTP